MQICSLCSRAEFDVIRNNLMDGNLQALLNGPLNNTKFGPIVLYVNCQLAPEEDTRRSGEVPEAIIRKPCNPKMIHFEIYSPLQSRSN